MKFIFGILGFIIGVALYKLVDFQNLSISKPALAIVYAIGFAICVYAVVKAIQKESKK